MAGKTSTKTAKKTAVTTAAKTTGEVPASQRIDARIAELGDWRGKTLRRLRKLIKQADPEITEEWKWQKASSPGVPVWSHGGGVCTGEVYKEVVKLTFFQGASLEDPAGLFNSSLEGNVRRAIDIREGEEIDEGAFKDLIRAAVSRNVAGKSGKEQGKGRRAAAKQTAQPAARKAAQPAAKPKLLSGGNPQIAKGEGDAPVQAYIAAMPGWKRDVGRRLDSLIERTVPGVKKAVKWNSPFYGIDGQGWFLNFHCFTKYVKVAFFRGTSLRPVPPGESKHEEVRYIDIHEDDDLDEARLAAWVKQASKLPGWTPGS
ncbi:MAG: DUF1801 domain-containing protein [Candidatus Eisenbacteria bacterium]